ncbi:excisionase family DNA-binding protein [Candidatus Zixiibacteriota bacterium]
MALKTGYLTTGEAASLCSVTPDTVLKWIKAGRIPANRTPGGHHRIPHSALIPLVTRTQAAPRTDWGTDSFQFCWEFNSGDGEIPGGCRQCIVYRSRSRRCYQMRDLPTEAGHARIFCDGPCEECEYYQTVGDTRANVVVVTDEEKTRVFLQREAKNADFDLRITDCEYRCSMMVEKHRPDYIVIDCNMGAERSRDFAQIIDEDPRIPFVRVILAGNPAEQPAECDKLVFAYIKRPFTTDMLSDLIEGSHSAKNGRHR